MKIKFNIIAALLLLLTGVVFTACKSDGGFDYDHQALFISGTENNPLVKFGVEDTPATYSVTVQSTQKVDQDVTLTLAIDPSKVDAYNAANKTSYYAIPEDAVELEDAVITIPAGSAFSSAAIVRVISTESLDPDFTYVIPVTVKSVQGTDEPLIEGSETIFLRISRPLFFAAIQANANASSNFIFDNPIPLTTWTYEMKVYPTGLSHSGPQRFMAMEQADESKALLLRFNEKNTNNQLEVMTAAGTIMSTTSFNNNQWYLLSIVFDGSTLSFYVDGVLDNSASGTVPGNVINFQRYEMGMSWTSYRSGQFFSHRFCEIRVWDRALSASEIQIGLCGVPAQSNGLKAYWKFNEGSGHIFADKTGHGFDMDWSKTQREVNEGRGLVATPDAANYIQWVEDDINKCIN